MSLLSNLASRVRERERSSRETVTPGAREARPLRIRTRAPVTAAAVNPDLSQPGSIAEIVMRQDNIPTAKRLDHDYLHVTDILDLCIRKQRLSRDLNDPQPDKVTGAHRVTWAMGRAAEHHFRTQYIKAVEYAGVYGRWSCPCGHTTHDGFVNRDIRCERCTLEVVTYKELSVFDHQHGLVGNPDLPLFYDGKFLITELKSMNREDYDALTGPVRDHVTQASAYHRIYRANNLPVHDDVAVIYVRKDFLWGMPYREFRENPNGQITKTSLDIAWANALELKNSVKGTPLPDRVCPSSTCTRAKNCHLLVPCWA